MTEYLDMQLYVDDVRPNEPYTIKVRSDATCKQLKDEIVTRFATQLPLNTGFHMWEKNEKRIIDEDESIEIIGANRILVFGKDLPDVKLKFNIDHLRTQGEMEGFELYHAQSGKRFPIQRDLFIIGRGRTNKYEGTIFKMSLSEDVFEHLNENFRFVSRHHAIVMMDEYRRDYFVGALDGEVWVGESPEPLPDGTAVRLNIGDTIYLREDELGLEFRKQT